jgi:hypothetical protein
MEAYGRYLDRTVAGARGRRDRLFGGGVRLVFAALGTTASALHGNSDPDEPASIGKGGSLTCVGIGSSSVFLPELVLGLFHERHKRGGELTSNHVAVT